MFNFQIDRLQMDMVSFASIEEKIESVAQVRALFQRSVLRGKLRMLWGKLTGRSPHLIDLSTVMSSQVFISSHDKGTQIIPATQIRGSESRAQDFDKHFNPLQEHTKQRWLAIAGAWLNDVTLPPVQVVQVDDLYFVRDGHHRISVARAMGQTFIDAEVTEWHVNDPQPIVTPSFCHCTCPAA